jgi:hypothetical protein
MAGRSKNAASEESQTSLNEPTPMAKFEDFAKKLRRIKTRICNEIRKKGSKKDLASFKR